MTQDVKTRTEVVQNGDTLASFAERHHADPREIVRLNEQALRDESQARGFNPTYERLVPDENGTRSSEMGNPCRLEIGWHVHAGQHLQVADSRDGD